MTNHFNSEEVRPNRVREMDNSGYVFRSGDKYYRAIFSTEKDRFDQLLDSGLIDKLVQLNLIPPTKKSEATIDDPNVAYLLEHEDAGSVTYPYEWSFNMVKDAGLLVLKVNQVAREFGFQTKDAHWYNVVFKFGNPRFVDIGSFIPVSNLYKGWRAYRDFIRSYYYPLYLWSKGESFFAQLSLTRASEKIPDDIVYKRKYLWAKLFSRSTIRKYVSMMFEYRMVHLQSDEKIVQKFPGSFGKLLVRLKNSGRLPFQNISLDRLTKKLERLSRPRLASRWGNYHTHFTDDNVSNQAYPRFKRIAELIAQYEIKSAVEIGGNQGVFSKYMLRHTPIEMVNCTDYDETAVDILYQDIKSKDIAINPALIDFAFPKINSVRPNAEIRLRSDAVMALAITHHLILAQKLKLEVIFEKLKSYSHQFVFVEFMPLGLHSSKSKRPPSVPEWYTQQWFENTFKQSFELLHVEQLEPNRVLFIGKH